MADELHDIAYSSSDDDGSVVLPKRARLAETPMISRTKPPQQSQEIFTPAMQTQAQMLQAITAIVEKLRDPTLGATTPKNVNVAASTSSVHTETRFRLPKFDPDSSEHTMLEWLDDVTKLKDRLNISEDWMIVRCADALKGRALDYYDHWRPIEKNWHNFVQDFSIAFPDGETPGSRMARAVALSSSNFKKLTEYALMKIRVLKRFMANMPWDTIVSCVEHGLANADARSLLRLQQPADQFTLLQLLGRYESQNATSLPSTAADNPHRPSTSREFETRRFVPSRVRVVPDKFTSQPPRKFSGACFNCGRLGHRQDVCRSVPGPAKRERPLPELTPLSTAAPAVKVPVKCDHCLKPGHLEKDCYSKRNGRPRSVRLIRPYRSASTTPLATILCEDRAVSFPYLVDTGAEVSILHEKVAKALDVPKRPLRQQIQGTGPNAPTTAVLGTCCLYVSLSEATVEISFWIVPDDTIPGKNVDVLIGMDVINRPGLLLTVHDGRADLCYNNAYVPMIATIATNELTVDVSGLDERQTDRLMMMLTTHRNTVHPVVTTGKMSVVLKNAEPVVYRPRRLAYAERVRVQKKISDLLRNGTIRDSNSSYASPIVLVNKKNNELRLCVDYRDVNKRVAKMPYPLPRIQDQIDSLSGAMYFTLLDMRAGFHQVEIEENSKHITAFITPDGHYEYNRMPFGYVNAPSIYQRAIDKALGNLKGSIALVYLDDILCPSKTIEEGLENLQTILLALAQSGFSLNYRKCNFFLQETEYLGLTISHGCVKPSLTKVEALVRAASPVDVRGVRQFMGLAGYFRKFIQGFSIKTAPITALLRKDSVFKWTDEHENVRRDIVAILSAHPVLRIYNPKLPIQLHTDASSIGIAGILMQRENDLTRPVAYYSRRTNVFEEKYHSYDLETLAIVDSIEHFRVYLYGLHFTVVTDCNSVRATAVKKELHPRVARWWMKLQDYDFDIEYRPGTKMEHVDYLSRNPIIARLVNTRQQPEKTLTEWQADDDFCERVRTKKLEPSEQSQYVVNDQLVYKRGFKGQPNLCYVPTAARLKTMTLFHDKAAHIGWKKGLLKMKETLFWPRMTTSFRKYVGNCQGCVLNKSHTGRRKGLFQFGVKPERPFDIWHIDHAGPLVRSNGNSYILVILDSFSKYCRLVPIPNKTAKASLKALKQVFHETGVPSRIVADRATAFVASIFSALLAEHNVELHLIATGVPRGNGQVERVMRTLFNLMRSTLHEGVETKWTDVLKSVEQTINNTVHETTKQTPNLLMFGETQRLTATQDFLQTIPDPMTETTQDDAIKHAKLRIEKIQKGSLAKLNLHRCSAAKMTIGMRVAVEDTQAPSRGKLGARFKGPYTIVATLPNDRYKLRPHAKSKRITVAARDQLRVWPDDRNTQEH